MELHSNLYYYHPDKTMMRKLDQLFLPGQFDSNQFRSIAADLNPKGDAMAEALIQSVYDPAWDLDPESMDHEQNYTLVHFVHGSDGDHVMEQVAHFLHELCPELDIRIWGCGDDDPWEYWLRYDHDQWRREDDCPCNDPEEDQAIKKEIYAWWHDGLPSTIREGFLNDPDYQDIYS